MIRNLMFASSIGQKEFMTDRNSHKLIAYSNISEKRIDSFSMLYKAIIDYVR